MRRSEFSSHYQNVHSEIHEGLDGWIIHRCPLHVFGCPYTYTRLHPGHKVSYNRILSINNRILKSVLLTFMCFELPVSYTYKSRKKYVWIA